ncbi:hypothetical protein AAE478_007669 [Parahypoxylon ruwenzoriense]
MRYITLFLSVLGLGALCASAPTDISAASPEAVSNNDTISDTDASLESAAPPKEDDADDEFVYQWRN